MIKKLLPFICLCIYACSSTNKYVEVQTAKTSNKINVDSSYIELEESNTGYIFSSLSTKDTDYLAMLFDSTLGVFNLMTGKKINELKISPVTNDDSSDYVINSICINAVDDIFTISIKEVTRYYKKSITRIELNKDRKHFLLYNLQDDHPYFDKMTNTLYLQKYLTEYSQSSTDFYKTSVLTGFNVQNGNLSECPVYYSALYLTNYYGFANHVYYSSNDSLSVISFPVDPNIYIYDRKNSKVSVVGGRSSFHTNEIFALKRDFSSSREEKMKHWAQIAEYNETLIDKQNGYIYRFFMQDQPLKDTTTGKYNKYFDKALIVMIFNNERELVKEFKIDNKLNNSFLSFTGNKKLYIGYTSPLTKHLVFKIIKVKG